MFQYDHHGNNGVQVYPSKFQVRELTCIRLGRFSKTASNSNPRHRNKNGEEDDDNDDGEDWVWVKMPKDKS